LLFFRSHRKKVVPFLLARLRINEKKRNKKKKLGKNEQHSDSTFAGKSKTTFSSVGSQ